MDMPLEHLPSLFPPPTRHYVLYEDGTLGLIEHRGQEPPRLARPGRIITEEEYARRRDQWEIAVADHAEKLRAADEERCRADFLALLASGIPEETARRLSGYTGDSVTGQVAGKAGS